MSAFYTCEPTNYLPNTGVGRACNCATNDSQPAESMDKPCCERAFTKRTNTTDCCAPKESNEIMFVCGTAPKAVFVGSILTTTLIITEIVSGTIVLGMLLSTAAGGTIVRQTAGDTGKTGTYEVSKSQTVMSTTLTAFPVATATTLTVTEVRTGMITIGTLFTYTLTYTDENGTIKGEQPLQNTIVAFGTGTGGAGTYTINPQAIPDGTLITALKSNTVDPLLNSVRNAYLTDTRVWGALVFPGATNVKKRNPLYPTTESVRILQKLETYKPTGAGGTCGFYPLGIPFIAPGCPPTPTEILNGSLPKPSTRNPCLPVRFEGVRNECEE